MVVDDEKGGMPVVRVYAVRWDREEDLHDVYDRLYAIASQERRDKARRYHLAEDGLRCLLAGALLGYAWRKAKGAIPMPPIEVNAYGKPLVMGAEDFCYNVSHGGNWVVLAWDTQPVGVDVEYVHPTRDVAALAQKYFSAEERAWAGETPDGFYRLWTAKESYLKYRGTGFACGADTPDFTRDGKIPTQEGGVIMRRTALAGNHWLAVCGRSSTWDVTWLSFEELSSNI